MTDASSPIRLGITVMPEYVQVEGIARVIDNVVGIAGARAICTVPAVMEPSDKVSGGREPPSDAGAGYGRTLDRPLWGRTSLYVRTAPSFEPNRARYAGLPYQPPPPDALTTREGRKVADFLDACRRAGAETQLQLMAVAPPGYRVQLREGRPEDAPLTAAGRVVTGRVDGNLSLASSAVRSYMAALITDLHDNYSNLDALRFDWLEYPPYHPASLSFDFNPEAIALGESLGFDAGGLRDRLRVTARRLPEIALGRNSGEIVALAARRGLEGLLALDPALPQLFAYRRALTTDYARFLAETARGAFGARIKLHLQGFPPPLCRLSGFDFAGLDGIASDLAVKLYTMHWPMIERAYVDKLVAMGAETPGAALALVRAGLRLCDSANTDASELIYPAPSQAHPASDALLEEKVRLARGQVRSARLWALTHGYGPLADVMRRFTAATRASAGLVHVNRYGYLSDAKIAAIGAAVRGGVDRGAPWVRVAADSAIDARARTSIR